MRRPASQHGFTLVEMLTVVALLVVLLVMAAPGMGTLLAKQRARSAATSLHLSLVRARSEALKANATVTVSPLSGSAWSSGWKVASASATLDTTAAPGGVLVSPISPATVNSVGFRYDGHTSTAVPVSFSVRDTSGITKYCVSVDPSGRAANKEGATC